MSRAAVPFLLKRSSDTYGTASVTTTSETVHGLLRLEEDTLVVQWRLARRTDHVGAAKISSEQEVEPVEEMRVPLSAVAGASVRRGWWSWLVGPRLSLNAADLLAFEELAGENGLKLDHPAELVLRLRRSDVLTAEEFCAELALAVAQRAMGPGPMSPGLSPARDTSALPSPRPDQAVAPAPKTPEAEPVSRGDGEEPTA